MGAPHWTHLTILNPDSSLFGFNSLLFIIDIFIPLISKRGRFGIGAPKQA
jgi:hypothetical protein